MNLEPTQGAPHFTVFGIPVRVSPMFVIISLVMSGGRSTFHAIAWLCVVFVSVLFHELGHALALIRYGGAPEIALHGMGGTTSWSRDLGLTHGQKVIVSLAGPFAGFLFGAFVLVVARYMPPTNMYMATVLSMLYWVNFAWGLFNLLPIVPLDGGHVMSSLLSMRWPHRAEAVSDVVTAITVSAVCFFAWLIQEPFIAIIALIVSFRSFQRIGAHLGRFRDRVAFSRANTWMDKVATSASGAEADLPDTFVGEARTAAGRRAVGEVTIWACLDAGQIHRIDAILAAHFKGHTLSPAVESRIDTALGRTNAAIARLEHGDTLMRGPKELYAYIEACIEAGEEKRCAKVLAHKPTKKLSPPEVLRAFAERSFAMKRYEQALFAFELGHLHLEGPTWAIGAARCLVRLERREEALAALEEAIAREGATKPSFESDPDLAALARDPALVARTHRTTNAR
jgi:Zn-dependent protease